MADFRFDIKPLFPQPIIKVTSNLLPHTFRGDRRQCLDATSKMSEIIDSMGQLSARSQGLNKPVTAAQRLRMSENQVIYLLADVDAGSHGAVTGLLKVGTKDLYLFDKNGQTRKIENAPCILDFYVHESRQRTGLGKHLFETMLVEEEWTPIKCTVDRPSEKLLGFLRKHYGLVKSIPQANNFVVYEGFFGHADGPTQHRHHQTNGHCLEIANSPNSIFFGSPYYGDDTNKRRHSIEQHGDGLQQMPSPNALLQQVTQISPAGRYGAPRPTCSMAESRHGHGGGGGGGGAAAAASNSDMKKYGSTVSLTPSQAAQRDANLRKSPLDALSRNTFRQEVLQKRSGLQDVDESYLNSNMFARSSRVRHSGLDDGMNRMQNQQQQQPMQSGGGHMAQAQVAPLRMMAGEAQHSGGGGGGAQAQYQQQQQQQQQQMPPPTTPQQQQQQPHQNVAPSSPQVQGQLTGQQQAAAGGAQAQAQGYAQQTQPVTHSPRGSINSQQQTQGQLSPTASQGQGQGQSQGNHQHQRSAGGHAHQHHHQQQQQQQGEPAGYPPSQQPPSNKYQQQQQQQQVQQQQQQQQQQAQQSYIIHAGSAKPNKGAGAETSSVNNDVIEALRAQFQNQLHANEEDNNNLNNTEDQEPPTPVPEPEPEPEPEHTQMAAPPIDYHNEKRHYYHDENIINSPNRQGPEPEHPQMVAPPIDYHNEKRHYEADIDSVGSITRRAPTFHLSKQHTGMKNRSMGVGMAVMPSNKMEFDQEAREDFGVVKINRPVGTKLTSPTASGGADNVDAMSTVSSGEGLTDQGYYDLKFYHNKLW